MKTVIGVLCILIGIVLGLYIGIWVCFIGGIVGLFNILVGLVNHTSISGMSIALNLAKIIFASLVGYLSMAIFVLPGLALFRRD